MVESFKDHPKSVSELRASRTESAADWTPRDVLVNVLRRIDDGEIDPDTLVVVWRKRTKPGEVLHNWSASFQDFHAVMGLLSYAQIKMTLSGTETD